MTWIAQAVHPQTDADYRAEGDLDAMTRAKEIERDPARLAGVKRYVETRKDELGRIAESLPDRPARRFNGTVRNSKMFKEQ